MATLSVRPVRIRDMPSLRQARQVNFPLGLEPPSPSLGTELLASMPLGRRHHRAYVATLDGHIAALVDLHPEPADFRWLVVSLSANAEVGDSPALLIDVWTELLLQAIRAAGASGAKRLHAYAPIDGPAAEALRRVNFTVYAQQTLLVAHGVHSGPHESASMREQEPSDAWSIHQLYHLATPRPIQFAEAYTSSHWDLQRRGTWRTRGFIVDREHEIVAYCRVSSRGSRHIVDLLALPGEAALLRDLVPAALERVGAGPRDTIWAAIPDYHSDYMAFLEPMGFTAVERQARMVRYTAVAIRSRLGRSLGLVPEMGERLTVRLPSFCRMVGCDCRP